MISKKLILLLILLVINGCGTIPDIHYYLIDYPIETSNDTDIKHDYIIGIESFKADPLYEENRLVYRESPYEAKFYNYHQWITPPKEIVTEKVLTQFTACNLFKQVVKFPRYSHVNFIIRGTIKSFEEWDEEDQWYASVKIHFELISRNKNKVIWQGTIYKKEKVEHKKPIEVVKVLGDCLQICIKKAITDVDEILLSY